MRLLFFCFVFLFYTFCNAQDTLAYWSFNQSDDHNIQESISGTWSPVSTQRERAEYVNGVSGKGLRTDGNSTWINTGLSTIAKPVSISGWFGLETFPTDTAGFFSLSDSITNNWVSVCVDRFGLCLLGVHENNSTKYFPAVINIPKFKWFKIALSMSEGSLTVYVNDKKAIDAINQSAVSHFNQILIGRDKRLKYVNIFPTTAIDGIIDEVTITTGTYQESSHSDLLYKRLNTVADLSVPEQRFKNDFNRPKYHLLPAANWTNETHGLIYFNNRYHIFNQKNGTNVFLGQINWGHYSSSDLVNWVEHIPALSPDAEYDEKGIWSGHVVMNNGTPAIMYTGGGRTSFNMCLAFPEDANLIGWKKFEGNPVTHGQPQGYARDDLHDPYLWKEKEFWYMAVGYGLTENGERKGSLLLYKSKDLKHWDFLHPLFTGDPTADHSGVFWEMPVFWKMNGKYILLINKVPTQEGPAVALYWVGDFKNEKFTPDNPIPQRLEVINRLLSPSVNKDAKGRSVAIAIIPDETSSLAQYHQGWTHLYSIPRVWSLVNGKIKQQPHPALMSLRQSKRSISNKIIEDQKTVVLSKGRHQLEFIVEVIPGDCSRFGFIVGKDSSQSELSKIYYDFDKKKFIVDQTKSSQRKGIPLTLREGDYELQQNKKVRFHVFIDGSAIEVFINDGDAFTTRIFPLHGESNIVELFSEGGKIQLLNADIWGLKKATMITDFKIDKGVPVYNKNVVAK